MVASHAFLFFPAFDLLPLILCANCCFLFINCCKQIVTDKVHGLITPDIMLHSKYNWWPHYIKEIFSLEFEERTSCN